LAGDNDRLDGIIFSIFRGCDDWQFSGVVLEILRVKHMRGVAIYPLIDVSY